MNYMKPVYIQTCLESINYTKGQPSNPRDKKVEFVIFGVSSFSSSTSQLHQRNFPLVKAASPLAAQTVNAEGSETEAELTLLFRNPRGPHLLSSIGISIPASLVFTAICVSMPPG